MPDLPLGTPGQRITAPDSRGRNRQYVADETGKFFQFCKPRGTRLTVTIPPDLERRLMTAPKVARELTRVVAEIAELADQTCPVGETGDLKASQVTEVRITPQGAVGVIGYTMFYAHMVHNGTSHSTANPWLLNAALAVATGRRGSGRLAA